MTTNQHTRPDVPGPLTEAEQAERQSLMYTAERGNLVPKTFARLTELNARQDAATEPAPGGLW